MNVCCYITFPTVFFALQAEALLKEKPYKFKMVPVPRVISTSCGTALRCSDQDIEIITTLFQENRVKWETVHRLSDDALK